MESIINGGTSGNSQITPHKLSNKEYYAWFENSFVVLNDCKTIIGIDAESGNQLTLIMEDLWDNNSSAVIGQHNGRINTILYLAGLNVLLVGDDNNQLVQYQQGSRGGWIVRRNYKDLGIDWIWSSTSIGNLAVLGGENGCVRVVDVKQAETLGGPYATAIEGIYTLQAWKASEVFLYVGGLNPDYSEGKTDLLSFAEIIQRKKRDQKNSSN